MAQILSIGDLMCSFDYVCVCVCALNVVTMHRQSAALFIEMAINPRGHIWCLSTQRDQRILSTCILHSGWPQAINVNCLLSENRLATNKNQPTVPASLFFQHMLRYSYQNFPSCLHDSFHSLTIVCFVNIAFRCNNLDWTSSFGLRTIASTMLRHRIIQLCMFWM